MDVLGLVTVPDWLLVILCLLALLYVYCTWTRSTFQNLGIPTPDHGFFGILGDYNKRAFVDVDTELVRKYGRVVGIFLGRKPVLMVSDPEMIKQICVKQFHIFPNRFHDHFPMRDTMRLSVNMVDDDHWKFQRNILTPTFSAGKLRGMQKLILDAVETMLGNARKQLKTKDTIEMKKFFEGFTMDVIASTGFGLHVDSQNNPDDPFAKNAKRLMTVQYGVIFIFCLFFQKLKYFFEWIGVTPQPADCEQFFLDVAQAAKEYRAQEGSPRNDLLQLMLNAHRESATEENDEDPDFDSDTKIDAGSWKMRNLTTGEILANSVIFLIAGFDTTANALTFATYLLATNPECQERLIQEIDQHIGKEKPTYDNVRKLVYLDNVLSETLRMYPSAARFNRHCKADTTVNGYHIPKGMEIYVSSYPMHHDPEFWPEPEKFDPDRFLPENKAGRHPYCYIPFGAGPRSCIGMRLARLVTKMALVSLLQSFRFKPCPETEIPPAIQIGASGIVRPDKPLPLKFEARQ